MSPAGSTRPFTSRLPSRSRRSYTSSSRWGGSACSRTAERLAKPFLDIRSRVGADSLRARVCCRWHFTRTTRRTAASTSTTPTSDGHTRVVEFRSDGQRGLTRTATSSSCSSANRTRTTTAASSSSGRTGSSTSAWGTAEAEATRRTTARPRDAPRASSCARIRLPVDWEIVGYGLRNPWRFSFDRKTGDLYIGDVGQNATRGDRLPAARRAAGELRLGPVRREPVIRERRRARSAVAARLPDLRVRPRRGLLGHGRLRLPRHAPCPAAVGRYFFGDYCSGNVWSLRVVDGKATGVAAGALRAWASLTSFGEGARGELYLVSHEGAIYRLAR